MESRNEIVLFETKDKAICLPVPIDRDTVWLTQDQMSELFDTARSSIAYHIGKIFKEGELQRDTSVEILILPGHLSHIILGRSSKKVNYRGILLSKFSTEVTEMLQDLLSIIIWM